MAMAYAAPATKLTISRFAGAATAPAIHGLPLANPLPFHAVTRDLPRRLISKLSVRTRIVAITLIPVVGFLANGLTFVGGEREVGASLDSLRQATEAADASREFKGAVVTIQAAARSFGDHPRPGYLQILQTPRTLPPPSSRGCGSSASDRTAAISMRSSARSRGCAGISRN